MKKFREITFRQACPENFHIGGKNNVVRECIPNRNDTITKKKFLTLGPDSGTEIRIG